MNPVMTGSMRINAIVLVLFFICAFKASAESKAFSGINAAITTDRKCSNTPKVDKLTLVLDEGIGSKTSGWFYGEGTSTGELHKVSPTLFEVIYPHTIKYKLPPSHLELIPSGDGGYKAIIRDYIPEDKTLRERICFFSKMEISLAPLNESTDAFKTHAKDIFSAEVLLDEAFDLIFVQNEYMVAEAKGYEALAIVERQYGKFTDEALNASAIVAFALMKMERFDEALKVIAPYHKALPNDEFLKELEAKIQKLKKQQDDLFRYDPDSKTDVDLEPLG